MLAVTRKTGYGLISMSYLSDVQDGKVASSRQIARLFNLSPSLLMNVLKDLATAGFVESVRGSRGGYRLVRRAEDINLAEIVTALEGPIRLSRCQTGRVETDADGACCKVDNCPVADPIHRVQRKLSDFFRHITLAEIARPGAGKEK